MTEQMKSGAVFQQQNQHRDVQAILFDVTRKLKRLKTSLCYAIIIIIIITQI